MPLPTVAELLARWRAAHDQGQTLSLAEVCAEYPHLLAALEALVHQEQTKSIHAVDPSATMSVPPHSDRTQSHHERVTSGSRVIFPSIPGYAIERELGRGGMGVVYQARDLKLNRIVAIKMILHGIVAGSAALVRFLTEAEAMAALKHPNIAHVHARGEYEGLPYFVMEYCVGGSLSAKINDQPLPAREAASLVEQLTRGIAAAHEQGILHRDLKPDNVLLTGEGTPKLTDFGLAKRLADMGEAGLTQTGAIMGTPSYMAPEQARGDSKRTGAATDVYGLGAILYRVLTGRPPFLGANHVETMQQVERDEPVSPTLLTPGLSRDLATICLKCLRKEPAHRYATATDLAEDLQRYLTHQPILARPVSVLERSVKWVRRNPVPTVATSVVVLALLAGTLVSYAKYRDAKTQEQLAKDNEGEAKLQEGIAKKNADDATYQRGIAQQNAEARQKALLEIQQREAKLQYTLGNTHMLLANVEYDHNNIALARTYLDKVPLAQRHFEWHYRARQLEGGIFTLHGHASKVTSVAYSPDGQRLATASDDGVVKIWNARTGQWLFDISNRSTKCEYVVFRADGQQILTQSITRRTATIWDTHTGRKVDERHAAEGQQIIVVPRSSSHWSVLEQGEESVIVRDMNTQQVLLRFNERSRILQAAYRPDGQHLALKTERGTQVHDATRGHQLWHFADVSIMLGAITYSPDGRWVISSTNTSNATLWDATTGALHLALKVHSPITQSASFSPDGRRIVTNSQERVAIVWDVATGQRLLDLKGHTDQVISVAYSPDGQRIVTGSLDGTAKVWDATSGCPAGVYRESASAILSATYSPDGRWIATRDGNNTIGVWDSTTRQSIWALREHPSLISSVEFSPDGRHLLTASWDKTVSVWDAMTGAKCLTLKDHASAVRQAAYSPDGHRIVSTNGNVASIWNATNGQWIRDLVGHTENLDGVAFSPDGQLIATRSENGIIKIWDALQGKWQRDLQGRAVGNTVLKVGLVFSPNSRYIAASSVNNTVKVWDVSNGQSVLELDGYQGVAFGIQFSPDRQRLLTTSEQTVKIWDIISGQALLDLKGHNQTVLDASFRPDGRQIVSTGFDRIAKLWDAGARQAIQTLEGHTEKVLSVAISPDGQRLVTGSRDRTAKIWERSRGRLLFDCKRHTDDVTVVAFSPDGRRVVTGSHDTTANVWDANTGQHLFVLQGHTKAVTQVAFRNDGQHLVTGSDDGTAIVWEMTQGQRLWATTGDTNALTRVAYSTDGRRLLTTTWLNRTVWDGATRSAVQGDVDLAEFDAPSSHWQSGYIAQIAGKRVHVIPLTIDGDELAYRLQWTCPDVQQHQDSFEAARSLNDTFAMRFHFERLLAHPMHRQLRRFRERRAIHADPRLLGRMAFHTPGLADTEYDRDAVQLLAVQGDPLAKRLVAQEALRVGKPAMAIPLLVECLLARPVTYPAKPPVEELLLAHAYRALHKHDEANRWYNAACTWLDKPRTPMRIVNIVTHAAFNGWAAMGEAFKPMEDPRFNTFDWEAWHECDAFRAFWEKRP